MYKGFMTSKTCGLGALTTCLIGAAMITASASSVQAQQKVKSKLWKDIGASERVDFSGRLHMLSQRIAASTCNLEAGVEPAISKGILAASSDELDRIVSALEFGNPLMKIIGQETTHASRPISTRSTASGNRSVRPLKRSSMAATQKANIRPFESWNVPFYEDANVLVSEVAAQYSDPADLLQGDAILVDLAGRQRMRTQMLLKEACNIWKDSAARSEQEDLMDTIGLFERTLAALRDGAPSVGIKPAPSEKIGQALVRLTQDWDATKPTLITVAQGQPLPDTAKTKVYLDLNEMLIKSNDIVALYTKYAKHAY